MHQKIYEIATRVLEGNSISYLEAIELININIEDEKSLGSLFNYANRIREKYTGNKVDLCSIVNAKSGKCSEDCKFCAQSSHYKTNVSIYDYLDYESILKKAKEAQEQGVHRFSLVTSGKGVTERDFENFLEIYRKLKQDTSLEICASHGIISYQQALKLKEVGISMYHHNVETSAGYYDKICTTHSYEERIETINNIEKAGLDICCGGIFGLGESREDRIKMAFEIKALGIKSIPLNILNPIKGTPLEGNETMPVMEILKTMAVYRYIIPEGHIRYAGGRQTLGDKQSLGFKAGINAALVGNYLTTVGSSVEQDKKMVIEQGFEI